MVKFNQDAWKTTEELEEEQRLAEQQAIESKSLEEEIEELKEIISTLFGKVDLDG